MTAHPVSDRVFNEDAKYYYSGLFHGGQAEDGVVVESSVRGEGGMGCDGSGGPGHGQRKKSLCYTEQAIGLLLSTPMVNSQRQAILIPRPPWLIYWPLKHGRPWIVQGICCSAIEKVHRPLVFVTRSSSRDDAEG
ncbi:hypothetical protein IAQ61_006211 [Plenodomus lingam]|uniref:uncharacterized protein n=1 Tax=Leptosphaeria maculans TaxID=5022 RepID=UPI00331FEEC8|nr:hypothetical protein IAQ61_006211 [Plenodomus lingam]